jgi:hypothetical protein
VPESPVAYAENTLGVHQVWSAAEQTLADLATAQTAAVNTAAAKRVITEQIADRELEVTNDERSKYTDLSQTAFEKHLRGALQADPQMKELRKNLMEAQRHHDAAEANITQMEYTLRTQVARMEELSGLLNFYAAAKQATNKTS